MPKKDKKPITSVIVVTKTLEAKAGSMLSFLSETGTNIPNKPATIIFNIIETAISIDNLNSLNQSCTIAPVIIAKIIPFKIPIMNSLVTIFPKFPEDNSFVAKALIVTAKVCIPALPPIEATMGIKTANKTISLIASSKR